MTGKMNYRFWRGSIIGFEHLVDKARVCFTMPDGHEETICHCGRYQINWGLQEVDDRGPAK